MYPSFFPPDQAAAAVRTQLARPAGVLLVEGGPATTTSRLFADGVAAARAAGADVLAATAFAAESDLAWAGLTDLLDEPTGPGTPVMPGDPGDPAGLGGPNRSGGNGGNAWRAALGALLPDAGDAREPDPERDVRAVAVAVRHLLRDLAARRPLLLAIDDVQWTDPPTQRVLAYALRRPTGIHVLLTRRDGPGPLPLLDGVPGVRRVPLPGPAAPPPPEPAARHLAPVGTPAHDGTGGIRGTGGPLGGLTGAERRVGGLVTDGCTNREIATRLHLSVRTVEGHLSATYRKVDARTRTELAVLALGAPPAGHACG